MSGALALLFHRGGEGLVEEARSAAALALARRLSDLPGLRVAVATRRPGLWEDLPVEVFPDPPGRWSFGDRLAELVELLAPERLLYFSAGSGVLLDRTRLGELLSLTPAGGRFAIFNNFYSTDFAVVARPEPAVFRGLGRDNALGTRLFQAGYRCYELPRSAETLLDIDTPGELQLLALHPSLPPRLAAAVAPLPTERARAIVELIRKVGRELLLVGRVSSDLALFLDREAACRVRCLSEERGMEATGRADRGEVKSLLSSLSGSPQHLVAALASLADGVVWDSRPYLAARGLWPLPEDRFALDLLRLTEVRTPLLREIGEAVSASPVPFLLGGQSLVSGGMYLACWLAWRDAPEPPDRWRPLLLPKVE
jgi:hypothetical protein